MGTEADTRRTLITPKMQAAGWEGEPHSVAEQRTFTDGRIVVHGTRALRQKSKRADYLLRYTRHGAGVRRGNPRAKEDVTYLPPEHLAADMLNKEQRIAEIMGRIQTLLTKKA